MKKKSDNEDLMDERLSGRDDRDEEDDDETESDPDRNGRDESDSASDAAEDLDLSSSDESDESEEETKVRSETKKQDDADGSDRESEGNSGEDSDDGRGASGTNRVGSGQEKRYEDDEEGLLVKEEQSMSHLFGDDDDDDEDDEDDEEQPMWESEQRNSRADEDDRGAAEESTEEDSRPRRPTNSTTASFTDELLMNGDFDHGGDSDHAEARDDGKPLYLGKVESFDAKAMLRNILVHVSTREKEAIKHGVTLDGPPMEDPIAHIDEFKRKFRWPVRMINLPNNDFSQDPVEIYNDYELKLKKPSNASCDPEQERQQSHRHPAQSRVASAFAQLPRPVVEAAAASAQHRSRKRKRLSTEPKSTGDVSAAALTNLARVGGRFADRFLDSLVSDNAAALQGANEGYSQRSWYAPTLPLCILSWLVVDFVAHCVLDGADRTSLPVTRKPVANWRFVLENVMKHHAGNSSNDDTLCPPLRKATLLRIRDRLKKLHALPWKTEDNELFARADRHVDSAPVASSLPTNEEEDILML